MGSIEEGTFDFTTLNVSTGNLAHANYFAKLRGNSTVVSFDVPKWFDNMIKDYAVPSKNYRKNPLNMNKTAPKIVDPTTPGLS